MNIQYNIVSLVRETKKITFKSKSNKVKKKR